MPFIISVPPPPCIAMSHVFALSTFAGVLMSGWPVICCVSDANAMSWNVSSGPILSSAWLISAFAVSSGWPPIEPETSTRNTISFGRTVFACTSAGGCTISIT